MSTNPRGVHLVGSIPLSDTIEVFTTISPLMPDRLKRIPDGETADRSQWVHWQKNTFKHIPRLQRCIDSGLEPEERPSIDLDQIPAMLGILHTGYDDVALESYRTFARLKEQGIIPSIVKFQVSVPTPLAAISRAIDPHYQAAVEPHWEAALVRDLRRIQDEIPHGQLAIQFDAMAEIFMLEKAYEKPVALPAAFGSVGPWFDNVREGVFERLFRVITAVDEDVDLGFHLCYGDQGHQHFMEPSDVGLMADVTGQILTNIQRNVQWVHMPVPKDRTDESYLMPLRKVTHLMKQKGTTIYLGLVHADDLAGTESRVATAQTVLREDVIWGVATECGMGRTPREQLASILDISKSVSRPC